MSNWRTILGSAAFLLFGCAGVIGVYLGVSSQADRLRPTVQTGAAGGPAHPSVIALDSARARTTMATSPRGASDQPAAPNETTSATVPPAASESAQAPAEPPSVVAALARGPQSQAKDQGAAAKGSITIAIRN